MSKRKKIKLNVRFKNGNVICAKSLIECRSCKDIKQCELMDMYYYPFQGIGECFKNNEKRK
jgi:hypothetical protein